MITQLTVLINRGDKSDNIMKFPDSYYIQVYLFCQSKCILFSKHIQYSICCIFIIHICMYV